MLFQVLEDVEGGLTFGDNQIVVDVDVFCKDLVR